MGLLPPFIESRFVYLATQSRSLARYCHIREVDNRGSGHGVSVADAALPACTVLAVDTISVAACKSVEAGR